MIDSYLLVALRIRPLGTLLYLPFHAGWIENMWPWRHAALLYKLQRWPSTGRWG